MVVDIMVPSHSVIRSHKAADFFVIFGNFDNPATWCGKSKLLVKIFLFPILCSVYYISFNLIVYFRIPARVNTKVDGASNSITAMK